MSDQWLTEDPAIYANDIDVSNKLPEADETVEITARIRNQGGSVAEDVQVRFYEQEPGNASRQIGDTIVVDSISPHENVTLIRNWTATRDTSRIYVVVDEDGLINELVETNNMEFRKLTVIVMEPPGGSLIINGGNPFTADERLVISFDIDSANDVEYVSFSNDNETWSEWKQINDLISWKLDDTEITRSRDAEDHTRTVYGKFRDVGGLVSEIITASVEYYPDGPSILRSSMDDGTVGSSSPIKIEFSNPMDGDSTNIAMSIDPPIDGSFLWINKTLYFEPLGGWTPEQEYNISILDSATDFAGRKLDSNYYWLFTAVEEGPGDDDDDDYTDTDGDGMPDWWEDLHGFNKTDPSDAVEDLDGDGRTNLEEYVDGTDPEIFDEPADGGDDDDDDGGEDDDSGMDTLLICAIPVFIVIILIAVIVVVVFIKRGGKSEIEE
jgi:hypothetical protein